MFTNIDDILEIDEKDLEELEKTFNKINEYLKK